MPGVLKDVTPELLLRRVFTASRTDYPEPQPEFNPCKFLSGPYADWQERQIAWDHKKEELEFYAYRAIAWWVAHELPGVEHATDSRALQAVEELEEWVKQY